MKMNYVKVTDVKENNNILWFKDICINNDKAWFVAGNYNGLYELSLPDGKVDYLGSFPEENIFASRLYERLFFYSDLLIAVPSFANSIGIYDLKTGLFEKVELPKTRLLYRSDSKFRSACMFKGKIYMFPGYYPYIVEFDIESRKVKVYEEWYDEYLKYGGRKNNRLEFFVDIVVINHHAYLVSAQHNIIFRFDLKSGKFEFYKVGWGSLTNLAYDGSDFWAINSEGVLFRWNSSDFNSVKEYTIETKGSHFGYSHVLYPYLILVPSLGSEIIYFNVENSTIQKIELEYDNGKYSGDECHRFYFAKKISDKEIILQDRKDKSVKKLTCSDINEWCTPLKDTSGLTQKNFELSEYWGYMKEKADKCRGENAHLLCMEENDLDFNAWIFYANSYLGKHQKEQKNCVGTIIHKEMN